jgi:hypothetical protein
MCSSAEADKGMVKLEWAHERSVGGRLTRRPT